MHDTFRYSRCPSCDDSGPGLNPDYAEHHPSGTVTVPPLYALVYRTFYISASSTGGAGTKSDPWSGDSVTDGGGGTEAASSVTPTATLDGGQDCRALGPSGAGVDRVVGIRFENTCWVEVQELTVQRCYFGIELMGHCWNMTLRTLRVRHNIRDGVRCRACPELWRFSESCTLQHGRLTGLVSYRISTGWSGQPVEPNSAPPVLFREQGYPSDVEIHNCLFIDNGYLTGSAGVHLGVYEYCTNFHIHHNLFCMSAQDESWSVFPPAPRLELATHDVDIGKVEAALASSGCPPEVDLVQDLRDACCHADIAADPTATSCTTGEDCACTGSACLEAAVAVKLCRGEVRNPYDAGACHRPSGDGINFLAASSGHVVERNTFIGMHANCETWSRLYAGNATVDSCTQEPEPGCCDTSDGDGIDFKDLRVRTPNCRRDVTVVRRNLFLFNEGPAIQAITGTQGLEIYRNVIAGNGSGIAISTNDQYQTYDEWACPVTSTSPDGTVTVTDEPFMTMGCFRIYRNLIYKNDRIDGLCAGTGTAGVGILFSVDEPMYWNLGVDPATGAKTELPGSRYSTRIADVWIVNNTIADNPSQGIALTRPLDCQVDAGANYPYQVSSCGSDVYDEWARVTDVHVLNNLLVGNNDWGTNACMQLAMGGAQRQWVGMVGDTTPSVAGGTYTPIYDDNRPFPESFEVDGNIYVRPDWDTSSTPNAKVARVSYEQARYPDMVNPFEFELSWDTEYGIDPFSSGNEAFWHQWLTTGFTSVSPGAWHWQADPDFGYDFESDWGTVELAWDDLPAEWNPERFRPDPASLAANGGTAPAGLLDHGLSDQDCPITLPGMEADVADGSPDRAYATDLLCDLGALHVGALAPASEAAVASLPEGLGELGKSPGRGARAVIRRGMGGLRR